MQLFNATRLGSFLQTLLYLAGAPLNNQPTSSSPTTSTFATRQPPSLHTTPASTATTYNLTRCYGVLGCIQMKYPRLRGFHLFPQEVAVIRPAVCLYVYQDRRCQPLQPDHTAIQQLLINHPVDGASSANQTTTSFWVTHGYLENGHRAWLQELTNELLDHSPEANVFVIDWGRGAEPPYTQAATNIEVVGAYVGYLMILLHDAHGHVLRPESAHFIGHSLGAHLGGVVGSWLRARGLSLGRITGMDPAQPYFELLPTDARLDAGDALFVDVIHTDAAPLLHGGTLTGLGTQEPCGHADFYPNEGKDQPGCDDGVLQAIVQEKGSFLYGLRRFFGCNHIRAVEYFIESVRNNRSFPAFACQSYNALERGQCSVDCSTGVVGGCNYMGFHAQKPGRAASVSGMQQRWRMGDGEEVAVKDSVLYFSMTATRSPYSREHYTLTLALTPSTTTPTPPGISALLLSIVNASSEAVLQELTVLEDGFAGNHLHQLTFGGLSDAAPSTALEIRMRPAFSSPLSWLAAAVGKQFAVGVEWLELKSVGGGKEVRYCPTTSRGVRAGDRGNAAGMVNLGDPQSQLVLRACAPGVLVT